MLRPRPVPAQARVWLRVHGSKRRCRSSPSIPRPVSETVISSRSPSTRARMRACAGLGVLDRVAGEVEHDLAHARGVAVQRVRHVGVDLDEQLERPAAQARAQHAGDRGQQPARVVVGGLLLGRGRPRRARRRARRGPGRRAPGRRRRSPRPARARARPRPAPQQQLGRAGDARQRRLDLVAHRRQELALLLLGELELGDVAERPQPAGGAVLAERDVVEADAPAVARTRSARSGRSRRRAATSRSWAIAASGSASRRSQAREDRGRLAADELVGPLARSSSEQACSLMTAIRPGLVEHQDAVRARRRRAP